ncbi:hypothetical protein L249_0335 [Ophiocordyceps polyrhachis-furcata BCC 54312]|uniref:BTB domain-containing protein n=1 Tax=Ophiocordyceps polyrhachis-furcata BCC 54312 TaxID=1330021 RepID=A0A367LDR6_9HYPO|nr:hypothetical protein L249_0335 [Ophiocordyceps polyrhachis-furcata BCC 54312]
MPCRESASPMVPQSEPPASSPPTSRHGRALCAASSVVSRPSLSRRKRYNRSHAGGALYVPQNEFPVFCQSGNVEILLGTGNENRYLLHRDTLARCSGFFEASTSSQWSKAQPVVGNELAHIREDLSSPPSSVVVDDNAKQRWTYELRAGDRAGDVPMLVQKTDFPTSSSSIFGPASKSESQSRPPKPHVSFSLSVLNLSRDSTASSSLSQADQDLFRDYDNLFRIFYNYPPILDGVNVADAYIQCKSLLALADQYDALAVVGPRVDHHLLQFQSRLWKQIAKYPVSYLRLGYLARSKVIFQEALIHVVGQWPVGERSLRATLPEVVMDIIEDKVEELVEAVNRVECRLFRLNLTTQRGDRVAPSNGYVDWLAVSLFRQWLAENTATLHLTSAASLPFTTIGRAYRTLGSSGPGSFLSHDECKRFLKLTPELYSRENLRRFERRLDDIKALARDLVQPLLNSGLELDMIGSGRRSDGIGYLTCVAVDNRDLPWRADNV